MKTLANIVKESLTLDEILFEQGGDVSDEVIAQIVDEWSKEITSDLANKADSYQFRQGQLRDGIDRMKSYAEKFSRAAKTLESMSDALDTRLKHAMIDLSIDEITGNMFRHKLTKTQGRLIIDNQDVIPDGFATVETMTVRTIDKKSLKDYLLGGGEVEGCRIEPSYSLRTYVNKEPKGVKK